MVQWATFSSLAAWVIPTFFITEAISRYYYANGESFEGISVVPEYQARFEQLAAEAINYYSDGD